MESANNNAPTFATVNPHSEKFTAFDDKRLFDRLQEKFTPKPYFHKYRILRAVVLATSYLFHLLSAATAFSLIYFFAAKLIPSVLVAAVISVVLLGALELSKRETSGRLFHDRLQFGKTSGALLAAVGGLAIISTACSYFGAQRVVVELTPPPALVSSDSLTAPLREQLATIDQQITAARATTWKGKTTTRAQRTVDRLTRQRETALAELVRLQQRADERNDNTEQQHATTTTANASTFAAFTAACELLLVLCLFYLQYYDFRSFAEYAKADGEKRAAPTVVAQVQPSFAVNGHGSTLPQNAVRTQIGFDYQNRDKDTQNVITQTVGTLRTCAHCSNMYEHGHARQRYCSDTCRVEAWEKRTGRTLKKQRSVT